MKKILIYMILFLVVVIIGEMLILGNFEFFLDKSAQKATTSPNVKATSVPNKIAITEPSTYNYWLTKKPIMTKSTKTDESEGKVRAIDSKEGVIEINGDSYPYALKIDLQNSKGASYTFIYDANDLKKTTIRNRTGKIDKASIQVGDTLQIVETVSLLGNSNSVIAIVITKK